jgi:hypothetical protein
MRRRHGGAGPIVTEARRFEEAALSTRSVFAAAIGLNAAAGRLPDAGGAAA